MIAANIKPTPITELDNPLNQLVDFEKSVETMELDGSVQVKLAANGKTIDIYHNDRKLTAAVERPIIHQLGSRIWGHRMSYREIEDIWLTNLANPEALEQKVAAVFDQVDLVARYYRDSFGADRIYGVVTPNFVEVNQVEFRQQFLDQLRQKTGIIPKSYGIKSDHRGDVVEHFDLNQSGFQTEYRYGLVYARNSGYQSYKVDWERWVLICSNGLKGWKGSRSRWKHTREIDLHDFIDSTFEEGVGHQRWLENKIDEAGSRTLYTDTFSQLLERLSLAKASKQRILNRLHFEKNDVGDNEWALSQALTWLGTHERAISFRNRPQLTQLGTDILEKSLQEVLVQDARHSWDGSYELLMPNRSNKAA